MNIGDVVSCFEGVDYSLDFTKVGYRHSWYDVDDDPIEGARRTFTFTVPEQNGTLYISVESYFKNMGSDYCYLNKSGSYSPRIHLTIYHNDQQVFDFKSLPTMVSYHETFDEDSYSAGDKFTIKVWFDWNWKASARDYSVVVYSKQNIQILDEEDHNNMLDYQGYNPSGFTSSFYRKGSSDAGGQHWTPPIEN